MSEEPKALYFSTNGFFSRHYGLRPHEDVPLEVAIKVAETVTEACGIVHNPKHVFLGDPDAPRFTDAVVAEVMTALQAQLDKEGENRTRGSTCSRHGVAHTHYYKLAQDLPPARQRALAERLWRIYTDWGGTVRTWFVGDPEPEKPVYAEPVWADYGYGFYGGG